MKRLLVSIPENRKREIDNYLADTITNAYRLADWRDVLITESERSYAAYLVYEIICGLTEKN